MKSIPRSAQALKKILPRGKTFCLVAGAFDLIHVGHLHLLEYAATLEELLVVAVLSDKYVRGYKDPDRPIINQQQRATMVAAIRHVDYVYIADVSPNDPRILSLLKPDSVVFGEDIGNETRLIRRTARVKVYSPRTKVKILPRYTKEKISSGIIIERIRSRG